MAIFTASVPNFSLVSTWVVSLYPIGHPQEYTRYISSGPTTALANKTFNFSGIPVGSTIHSAVLTATLGSPATGAALRTVDGKVFRGSLSVAINIGGSKAYGFAFKANGAANAPVGSRTSSQAYSNVKITVDYTPPHTRPEVSNVKIAGGTTNVYTAPKANSTLSWTGTNGDYNPITKYRVQRSINGGAYADLSETTSTSLSVAAPTNPGDSHRYRVIAVGEYSNSTAITSPLLYAYKAPGAPNNVSVSPATVYPGDPVTVSWTASAAGVGVSILKYEVYRGATLVGSTTTTSLATTAPAAAGSYNYTVKAISSPAGYNSAMSAAATLTVENPASTGTLNKAMVPMDGVSTITLTINTNESGVTHKVTWKAGVQKVEHTLAQGVLSDTLDPVPLAWNGSFRNNVIGTATVVLETFKSSVKVGEKAYNFTVTVPPDVVPDFDFADTLVPNGVTSAITKYVQGYSKVQLDIQNAAGAIGSSIVSYRIAGGGYASDDASATFGPLNVAGNTRFTAKVTDTRGRSTAKTLTIAVQPYAMPSLSGVEMQRADQNATPSGAGTYVRLKALRVFSSIDGENTATLEGRVFMRGASPPSTWEAMTDYTPLAAGFGVVMPTKSYFAQIRIKDLLNEYVMEELIPTETVGLHILDGAEGAALGKYCETPGMFQLPDDWTTNVNAGKLSGLTLAELEAQVLGKAFRVGHIHLTMDDTNPGTYYGGTWTLIAQGTFLMAAGSSNPVGSTGGEARVSLTESQMPQHLHEVGARSGASSLGAYGVAAMPSNTGAAATINTSYAGSGQSHENLPPYLAVYMWQRTA